MAAPIVTAISGTIGHGETITISGSNFGTKATAAPLIWDDFEDGAVDAVVTDTHPITFDPGTGAYTGGWDYPRASGLNPNGVTYTDINQRGVSTRCTYHDYTYQVSALGIRSHAYGQALDGLWDEIYISWWRYLNITTMGDPANYKEFRVRDDIGSGQSMLGLWTNSLPGQGGLFLYYAAYDGSDWGYNPSAVYCPWPQQVWERREIWFRIGDTPGQALKLWVNGVLKINWDEPSDFRGEIGDKLGDGGQNMEQIWISDFIRSGSQGYGLFDDIYIDTTQARVEIGDAATWEQCTHREVQIPSAWAAGSITATVNQGSFADGGTAYLFVVNDDGEVSYPGHQIQFGETGADTQPPYVPAVSCSPGQGAVAVPLASTISFHIRDDGDGVDSATIAVQLDDAPIVPDSVTGAPADYTVTYDPGGLAYDTTYNVKIDADDLAAAPNSMTQVNYNFSTVEKLPGPGGGWTVDGMTYSTRRKLTINSDVIDAALTDLPVLVKLTAARFDFSDANADGYDIRFTASDGTTLLKYERELHDSVGEVAYYWVKVPSVASGSDTVFYMYYRTDDTADGADPTNVWDANYVAVYHMSDLTTSTIEDSTSNNNDGDKKGANEPIETATAKIYEAQDFDGTDDYVDIGDDLSANNEGTCSLWARIDNINTKNSQLFSLKEGADTFSAMTLRVPDGDAGEAYDGKLEIIIKPGANNTLDAYGDDVLSSATWHHCVVTMSSADGAKLYVDGNLQSLTYLTGSSAVKDWWDDFPASTAWALGAFYYGGTWYCFPGNIDEVHICDDARTAAEIKADFYAQDDNLLTYGSEEVSVGVYEKQPTAPTDADDSLFPSILGETVGYNEGYVFSRSLVYHTSGAYQWPFKPDVYTDVLHPRAVSSAGWVPLIAAFDAANSSAWQASQYTKGFNVNESLWFDFYKTSVAPEADYVFYIHSNTSAYKWDLKV